MRWLEDIPYELRLDIYERLCRSTPVRMHNIDDVQACDYLNDKTQRERPASAISLMLTCKAVRAEFEPIFWGKTRITTHIDGHRSCFYYCLPCWTKSPGVSFFQQRESRRLEDFFASRNVQIHIENYRPVSRVGPCIASFMQQTYDRFTISEPLGCIRYPVERSQQLRRLVHLLQFCRGRVRELEFWWHPVRWRPAEAAAPWRITVDADLNFTIRGPTRTGFVALRKRFSKALWEFWPCRTWDRQYAGSQRRAISILPRPQYTFVEDHENTRPDHTAVCSITRQKRYEANCNCGDPGHFGGSYDIAGTEGT